MPVLNTGTIYFYPSTGKFEQFLIAPPASKECPERFRWGNGSGVKIGNHQILATSETRLLTGTGYPVG